MVIIRIDPPIKMISEFQVVVNLLGLKRSTHINNAAQIRKVVEGCFFIQIIAYSY